ncbi:MAG: hypothetical protein IPL18_12005 [Sphingomonadales bacterium]|nr:hypothetical protein [Sphingomonadales bacterium]
MNDPTLLSVPQPSLAGDAAAQYWAIVRAGNGRKQRRCRQAEALLRLSPNVEAADQALITAMADPATAADMIKRATTAKGWPESIVRRIGTGSAAANAARLALIEGACAQSCKFDRSLLLTRHHRYLRAILHWRSACGC